MLLPKTDEYLSENLPASAERLTWLTGFKGSLGLAVVLQDKAALFVDGRYSEQVKSQVPASLYEFRHLTKERYVDWLQAHVTSGAVIGYDPWLHSATEISKARDVLKVAGIRLIALEQHPVDLLWEDRPETPLSPIEPHLARSSGTPSAEKCAEIGHALASSAIGAAILTRPDSVAWLLNIRGADVAFNPAPLARAIIHAHGKVELFIAGQKVRSAFGGQMNIFEPSAFGPAIDALGRLERPVLLDCDTSPAWVHERLVAANVPIVHGADPCELLKARKNAIEVAGARAAHVRDGRAVIRLLAWLDARVACGEPLPTEVDVADHVRRLRAEEDLFRGLSFETIAAVGFNAAQPHYQPTPATNLPLSASPIFLLDGGGQYFDGTTDVTRTVATGTPTSEMVRYFTLVLKGHIAIATARFPHGTTGGQLDALARMPLWQADADYDHGTGHGVGSYLSVHEGPQRFSKTDHTTLDPGMILSNEPGYYRAGAFGIRTENLLVVRQVSQTETGVPMLDFETLTVVPIDRRLINPALLTYQERSWLNNYHARVRAVHERSVDSATRCWLERATMPI